jgi:hypothetical protein
MDGILEITVLVSFISVMSNMSSQLSVTSNVTRCVHVRSV